MAWLGDWAKRVKLTIDNGDITAGLVNFPMLLYLSTSSGRGPTDLSCVFTEIGSDANRKKIAVTIANGITQCYVEIEKWSNAAQKAWLWVKVPSISSSTDTDLYLYYDSGKADNTTYIGDCADGSAATHAVWDSNFKMVHHMRDVTTSLIRDSTSNNNDGTKKAGNQPVVSTAGQIADAQAFDGADDYVNCGSDSSLEGMSQLTIEVWYKSDGEDASFLGFGVLVPYRCYRWMISEGFLRVLLGNGNWFHTGVSDVAPAINTWEHAVFTFSGTHLKIFTAGVEQWSADPSGTIGVSANDFLIGMPKPGEVAIDGLLDEVRISATCRTPAWVKASYECQVDDLLLWGSEEEEEPPVAGNPWYVYAQQQ